MSLKDLVHATSLPDPDVGIARGLLVVGRETQETGECHNKPEYQDVCVRTGSLACGRTRGMVLLIASVVVVGLVAAGCYLYR